MNLPSLGADDASEAIKRLLPLSEFAHLPPHIQRMIRMVQWKDVDQAMAELTATVPKEHLARQRQEFLEELRRIIGGRENPVTTSEVLQRTWDTSTLQRVRLFPDKDGEKAIFTTRNPSIDERWDRVDERDTQNFGHALPVQVNTLRNRAGFFPFDLWWLAAILHRYLGAEAMPLVHALWKRGQREAGSASSENDNLHRALTAHTPEEVREAVERELEEHLGGNDPLKQEHDLLDRAFGEAPMRFLCSLRGVKYVDLPNATLTHLADIAAIDRMVRWKVCRALQSWMRFPDTFLASAMIREGWRDLASIREVTDSEWLAAHERDTKGKQGKKLPPLPASSSAADENAPPRLLRDIIDTARHRRELEHLRSLSFDAAAAKETAIAHEVYGAVVRVPYGSQAGTERPPSYRGGFPSYVTENRAVNCLTGPWLIAALMRDCGVPEEQLLFCNVIEQPGCDQFGSHGSILLSTSIGTQFFIDRAWHRCGHPFDAAFCTDECMKKSLTSLLKGETRRTLTIRVDPKIAEAIKIPLRFQLSPLSEGFAATHMLNVGLSFFHEGKLDEAQNAFELGLTFNPDHPDLLYFLGLIAFKRSYTGDAYQYLRAALKVYDRHLLAHLTIGELYLHLNFTDKARAHFSVLQKDLRHIWGEEGGQLRGQALRYLNCPDDGAMLREWQGRNAVAEVLRMAKEGRGPCVHTKD